MNEFGQGDGALKSEPGPVPLAAPGMAPDHSV